MLTVDKPDTFLGDVNDKTNSPILRGQSAVRASTVEHKPRMKQIAFFILVMGLCWMSSSTSKVYNYAYVYWSATYGWLTSAEQTAKLFQANSIDQLGSAAGSVAAGILVVRGRKLALTIAMWLLIFGSIFSFILNWPLYLVSRCFVAFGIGIQKTSAQRYTEEYLPLALFGSGNAVIQFFSALGDFESSFFAFIYPKTSETMTPEEQQEVLDTKLWWLPMANQYLFMIPAVVMLCFISDTPKFYISKGDFENAKKAIHEIYDTSGMEGQANRITRFIGNTGDQKVTKVSVM